MSCVVVKEVIKPGISTGPHDCEDFYFDKVNLHPPVGVIECTRICSKCGQVVRESIPRETEDFDSIYKKFHGMEVI